MTAADVVRWLMTNKRLGVRDATVVGMALVQWSIATDRLGHFASISEFMSWSGESDRTVERRRARIRRHLAEDEFRWLVDELVAGASADAPLARPA